MRPPDRPIGVGLFVPQFEGWFGGATAAWPELLAFARNNVVTRQMLLKHLYRRADDQPQPKIIDVFISKLRKKLRSASGGAEFIETIPQRGWILRDIETATAA